MHLNFEMKHKYNKMYCTYNTCTCLQASSRLFVEKFD